MSNKIITKNDLAAVLNEVLPPTPSEYKKLLWSNPSASYSTGTVSLDLSEYDEVEVVFATDDGLVVEFSASCPVGKSGHGEWWDIRSDLSNYAAINGVTRSFSTSSTGVTFQNGNMLYNGASYNGWASRAIPRRIYGIKYERVNPPQVEYPTYSTEEQQVGTWVTGKPLYRKVFQYASMPNNTTAVYAHNISNMDVTVRYSCCWWDSNDSRFITSPRVDSQTIKVSCTINKTNIILEAIGTNWSTRTSDVNVIVEYTKTTD